MHPAADAHPAEAGVQVRLFAAARAAAGGQAGGTTTAATLAALRTQLVAEHGPPMARVLPVCSFLLDGVAVGRGEDRPLAGVRTVDVLPPFAGG